MHLSGLLAFISLTVTLHPMLMLLVYYRLYASFTLAGFLFDLDQSNVCRDIRYLEPLVRRCIPIPKKVHKLTRRLRTIEEVEEYFPGFKAFIDATEQEIPRPKDKRKRRSHYSGKKRRHTVKTQLTVNSKGLIIHRTNHARGRRHDYDIFKRNHPELPKGLRPGFDLGYHGVQNDFPELNPLVPFKRSKYHRLTRKEKAFNRKLSKARVVVEHTISRLKKPDHLRAGVQEQVKALQWDGGDSLRADQPPNHGEQGAAPLASWRGRRHGERGTPQALKQRLLPRKRSVI